MLVSVVVPVYNVGSYIEACLASVGRQTYNNVECLVVDDCGADDSMIRVKKFVDSYQGTVSFRIISHRQNAGLSVSRNTGMNFAKGDFIYFLDGDDLISDDCLSVLVREQQQNDADCVVGSYRQISVNGSMKDFVVSKPRHDLLMASVIEWQGIAWNMLVRKRFIRENNLFFEPGILHEDLLWNFFLLTARPVVAFSKTVTYFYNMRSGSIMTQSDETLVNNRFASYQLILDQMNRCIRRTVNRDAVWIGAAFFVERTARMMSCIMLEHGRKQEAFMLFHFAKEVVDIPWSYCLQPSKVRWKDRVKLFYRLFPTRLAFNVFSMLTLHHRQGFQKKH